MAIFPPLSIARSALTAHQRALGVTAQNIANAQTDGYTRQRPRFTAVPTQFGAGVRIDGAERIVDRFLEERRLEQASTLRAATTQRDVLGRVEGLFPVQGSSVGTALDEFFSAADALANDPESLPARQELLSRGEALARSLNGAHRGLARLQRELDDRIGAAVGEANGLLARLARLNRSIAAASAGGGDANELRDQRAAALHELSGYLRVRTVERDDGTIDVFAASSGAAFVVGDVASELAVEPSGPAALDGGTLSRIGVVGPGGTFLELSGDVGGSVGALQSLRDGALPVRAGQLDAIATALRDEVNAVQTDPAAIDLNGATGLPFFSGSGAGDLAVALTDPRGIAAAQGAATSDNRNALALAGLRGTAIAALGGSTFGEAFSTIRAGAGSEAAGAKDVAATEESVDAALSAQRDAISGVSLEEEFVDLIRFQRGFQAAAQIISVGDRLLDEVIGLLR